jgi:hypothetical protein
LSDVKESGEAGASSALTLLDSLVRLDSEADTSSFFFPFWDFDLVTTLSLCFFYPSKGFGMKICE